MVAKNALKSRRVVILVQNLPVPFDRRVWQEALALRDHGADVSVVCPATSDYPEGSYQLDGIRILRFHSPTEAEGPIGYIREYSTSLWRMSRALRTLRGTKSFDVVHFCNPPDLLFLLAWSEKILRGSRIIFDQHDLGPELVMAKGMRLSRIFVAVARSWEWFAYRVADQVIATNESYRAVAIDRGSVPGDRVRVVRSGPRKSWIKYAPPTKRWSNEREYMVGYVGVMGRQEGIEYLLEAASTLVKERGMDVQFCLVGSGTDLLRLQNLTVASGLKHHVSFLGRLSDQDLRSVLTNADVCVNPDEVNELNDKSTMNKILEYMALGRPIVQFDVTEGRYSAKEASAYAKANDSGALADELERVLLDPELASRMGQFGKTRFENHLCWEQQVPQLISSYVSAIGTRQ